MYILCMYVYRWMDDWISFVYGKVSFVSSLAHVVMVYDSNICGGDDIDGVVVYVTITYILFIPK